ncbi:MAG: hypothetical protein LW875_03995 [Proteobacteria bacterium]|jgi:hypothetical protein|nr:hypothetical protein [Pseudomonadota bacterium]
MGKLISVVSLFGFSMMAAASAAKASEVCLNTRATHQIIILPPTGGANSADRSLFKALCRRGHEVRILDYSQKSGLTTDLSIHDRFSREVLTEIDRLLGRTEKSTVLIGASLGGLYTSMAFGYSLENQAEFPNLPWIKAIVLTVAGGQLSEILANSELKAVKEQRELRLRELSISGIQDYQLQLEKAISYDPLKWARPDKKNKVLMFNSNNDSVVPTSTQEKLWKAWGEPQVVRLSTNHQFSIGRVYFFMEDRIDSFVKGL